MFLASKPKYVGPCPAAADGEPPTSADEDEEEEEEDEEEDGPAVMGWRRARW
jgi:ribosomal protein L12E/L44/L45/RPP1/RPP2